MSHTNNVIDLWANYGSFFAEDEEVAGAFQNWKSELGYNSEQVKEALSMPKVFSVILGVYIKEMRCSTDC